MDIIMPLILYTLEVSKYCLGNEIFFHGKVKHVKSIGWIGCVYFVVTFFWGNEETFKFLLAYLFAMMSAVGIIEGNVYTRVWHTLCILGITVCLDKVISTMLREQIQDRGIESVVDSLITLCIFLIIKFIRNYKYRFIPKDDKYISVLLGSIVLILCLTLGIGIAGLQEAKEYIPFQVGFLRFDYMFNLTYVSVVFLILLMIYIIKLHTKLEENIKIERELKEIQKNYFQSLLQKEENTRRYRHDMNNHILCISQMAENEQAWQTLNYVQDLQEELSLTNKKVYNTGIEILDILLSYYLVGLEGHTICVKGKSSRKLQISDVDFCVIFSNLICNAIEEIKRMNRESIFLKVEVRQGEFYTRIKIANSSNLILKKSELPVSKKIDKQNHGIGLKNVKETIEKNESKLEITADGKEFSAVVTLKNDLLRS